MRLVSRLIAAAVALSLLSISHASSGAQTVMSAEPSQFVLGTASKVLPILLNSNDAEAVHIAAGHFAEDLERILGAKPHIYHDSVPRGVQRAIVVCTVHSKLASLLRHGSDGAGVEEMTNSLEGKWESFEGRVMDKPIEGLGEALVLIGSDRVSLRADLASKISLKLETAWCDLRHVHPL